MDIIFLHGLPTATQLDGIFFVTTEPAPIIVSSPILTPGSTIVESPMKQLGQSGFPNEYLVS